MKFSGKMWLMITLKVEKSRASPSLSGKWLFEKTKGGGGGGVSFNYERRNKIAVTLNSSIRNYFDTYCLLVKEVDGKAR